MKCNDVTSFDTAADEVELDSDLDHSDVTSSTGEPSVGHNRGPKSTVKWTDQERQRAKAERILGEPLTSVGAREVHPGLIGIPDQPGLGIPPMPDSLGSEKSGAPSPRSQRLPLTSNPPSDGEKFSFSKIGLQGIAAKRAGRLLTPVVARAANEHEASMAASGETQTRSVQRSATVVRDSIVILRVYGMNKRAPRSALVHVPARRDCETSSQGPDYDDEAFLNSLRATYRNLRGPIERIFCFRALRAISLPEAVPDTATGRVMENGITRPRSTVLDEFAQSRLFEQYQGPGSGRGKYEWVNWVRGLPASEKQTSSLGEEKIVWEFVEGWAMAKIAILYSIVLGVSILTAVLWIVFGVDQHPGEGWRGAGGRVQTGAVLAGLVLCMGWGWLALLWVLGG